MGLFKTQRSERVCRSRFASYICQIDACIAHRTIFEKTIISTDEISTSFKDNIMKRLFLLLGSLLILVSCAKPNVHDPNARIKVSIDDDKYIIPLNHITRPVVA